MSENEATENQELSAEELQAQEEADFNAAYSGDPVPSDNESSISDEEGAPGPAAEATGEGDSGTGEEPGESALSPAEQQVANLSDEAVSLIEQRIAGKIEQKFSDRLRNFEGHIGGLKQQLQQMATAKAAAEDSGADAPTAQQMKEASQDGEKLAALREDFPEFADALDEVRDKLSGPDLSEYQQRLAAAEERANSTAAALEEMRLESKHADWRDTVNTDEYKAWLIQQPQELIDKHVYGKTARDAIEVLDAYQNFRQQAETGGDTSEPPMTSGQQKAKNRRLEDAIQPTRGQSTGKKPPKTEHEEFLAAFNS